MSKNLFNTNNHLNKIKNKKLNKTDREIFRHYKDRNVAWFSMIKTILLMTSQTCKETKITTRMKNQNSRMMYAFQENKKYHTKLMVWHDISKRLFCTLKPQAVNSDIH